MHDPSPFGEPKRQGFLGRLLARAVAPRPTQMHLQEEELRLIVPEAKAEALKAVLQQWLAGKGITAPVTHAPGSDGNVQLVVHLDELDSAKLDLRSDAVEQEIGSLLTNAVGDHS